MKKELPIMIFHKDNQDYYGGDQDWFSDEWQDVQDVQVSVLQIWPASMNIS